MFNLADEYRYDRDDTYTGPRAAACRHHHCHQPRRPEVGRPRAARDRGADPAPGAQLRRRRRPARQKRRRRPGRHVRRRQSQSLRDLSTAVRLPDARRTTRSSAPVCRRKIIRDLVPKLNDDRAVFFTNLLVRDDEDPWPRGNGEIYLNYDLHAGGQTVSGRWPAGGRFVLRRRGCRRTSTSFAGRDAPATARVRRRRVDLRVRESDLAGRRRRPVERRQRAAARSPVPSRVDRDDYRLNGTRRQPPTSASSSTCST